MTSNDGPPIGRKVARWAAMAFGTYLLMGVVYALLVFAAAGETVFSGASFEVITSFILPAFYANPARALTAPAIGATALVVSAVTVVLVTRAIQSARWRDSTAAGTHAPRNSK